MIKHKRKPHSEETKEKIREKAKGRPNPRKGKKGKSSEKAGKTFEELYGEEKAKELKEQHSKALKGRISHRKGKKLGPQTQEHKRKCGDARRGNPHLWMKGENNPAKRLEVRKKISDSNKISLNKPEVKEKFMGENNHSWNPNREEVFAPYSEEFYNLDYRDQIKREQNCIDPIMHKQLTKSARLHHIDYNKQNSNRENLIWLNIGTHSKTNYDREKWKILLKEINENTIRNYMQQSGEIIKVNEN